MRQPAPAFGEQRQAIELLRHRVVQLASQPAALSHDRSLLNLLAQACVLDVQFSAIACQMLVELAQLHLVAPERFESRLPLRLGLPALLHFLGYLLIKPGILQRNDHLGGQDLQHADVLWREGADAQPILQVPDPNAAAVALDGHAQYRFGLRVANVGIAGETIVAPGIGDHQALLGLATRNR